jgi:hypothetical protein
MSDYSTSYLVEAVFVESISLEAAGLGLFIDHYQSDQANRWPLISVKAVLAEEDPALIKTEAGEPCEYYNVYIVIEWPLSLQDEMGANVSAAQIEMMARLVQVAIRAAGVTDAIEEFDYFEIEPLQEGEKDIEQDQQETPTRRVNIASFQAIVMRG